MLGQGQSHADGRFQLDVHRTASARIRQIYALATAPGYGLAWAALNPDAAQPTAEIKLRPEQVVRVRLLNVIGVPARGVEVRIVGFGVKSDKVPWDGLWTESGARRGFRAWPRPVTSNDQGRIALPGIGRGVSIDLQVRDVPFARQELHIDADTSAAGKEIVFALEPARIIEGRALAADTGRPIPNTIVTATTRIRNERPRGSSPPSSAPTTRGGSS